MSYPKLTPVVATGATEPRLIADRFADVINVLDFGAAGDGDTDDTAAISAACAAAAAAKADGFEKSVYFPGGKYLVSDDIEFAGDVVFGGCVSFRADDRNDDAVPTRSIYFNDKTAIEGVEFYGFNVFVSKNTQNTEMLYAKIKIQRCVFYKSSLNIGDELFVSSGFSVKYNSFYNPKSRIIPGIVLTNVGNIDIMHNTFVDRSVGVRVKALTSFACYNINISNNLSVGTLNPIHLLGTSMYRIVDVTIKNNTFSNTRNTDLYNYGIDAAFCIGLTVDGNNISCGIASSIRIEHSVKTKITNNSLTGYAASLRVRGVQDLEFAGNRCMQEDDGGFGILVVALRATGSANIGFYTNKNIKILDNSFMCKATGISLRGTAGAEIARNKIRLLGTATGTTGYALVFQSSCSSVYYWENRIASNVNKSSYIDDASSASSSAPPASAVYSAYPAPVVSTPVITNSDSSLNGAKSYVVTFTLGHYTQLKQLCSLNPATDEDVRKTLTQWMSGVSGATLAWNSSPWNTTIGKLGDIVVNGVAVDHYGGENWWMQRSMCFIDEWGRLSCREFFSQERGLLIGAHEIAEGAWNTANFRAPLVVDGADYGQTYFDKSDAAGFNHYDYENDVSGRTCLGQKDDGTFVLLVADGATGVNGPTMKQCAQKLLSLGCLQAFNLDGGGSTTLWYNGSVINTPSGSSGERAIPCCMYL